MTKEQVNEAGKYYEYNYFPEDIEFLNKTFGTGRVVVFDDVTEKEMEAIFALEPLKTEHSHAKLVERVTELYKHNWALLLTSFDTAPMWRRLLGRALYKQMKHFRIFVGTTPNEHRQVHFFMIKKTPQFKKSVYKFRNVNRPVNAGLLKRLCIIADMPDNTVNFMGIVPENRDKEMDQLLKTVLM